MNAKLPGKMGVAGKCRALIAAGLLAAELVAQGQPSPVGSWEFLISGKGQVGMAFINFSNDFTFQGYELDSSRAVETSPINVQGRNNGGNEGRNGFTSVPTNSASTASSNLFGFGPISGPWRYDVHGHIIGNFTQLVDVQAPVTNTVANIEALVSFVVRSGSRVDYDSTTNLSLQITNLSSGTNNGVAVFNWQVLGLDQLTTNRFSVVFKVTDTNLAVTLPVTITNADGTIDSSGLYVLNLPYTNGLPLVVVTNLAFTNSNAELPVTNMYLYAFSLVTSNTAIFSSGGTTNGVSFTGVIGSGRHFTIHASSGYGMITYRGIPLNNNLVDLSGDWYGKRKKNGQTFLELFSNHPFTLDNGTIPFPNLYYTTNGTGPGYTFEGVTMLSARKRIGFAFATFPGGSDTALISGLMGPMGMSGKGVRANTTGTQEPDAHISFKAQLIK
jgi:hypothetical protein